MQPVKQCRERDAAAFVRPRYRFVVVVFQPAQVRAYAKFHLQRAKNDKIDAALIAACTAAVRKIHAAPDPRLQPFAEQLTMIDQINEDTARLKNRLESCRNAQIKKLWQEDIARLKATQAGLLAHALSILKTGGKLVYSVCSLQPEEGEQQIAQLLNERKDVTLLPIRAAELGLPEECSTTRGEIRTLPCHLAELGGMDGFYAAVLKK